MRLTLFRSAAALALFLASNAGAQDAPKVQYYNPDWSPDGKTIVFESTRDGRFAIYAIGVDGSGLRRLTSGEADDEQPRWSRDGRHIVFISDRDGHLQLYVMRADGSDQRRITSGSALDYDPSLSRDGRRVVFMTRPERASRNNTLAITGTDGRGRRALTDGAAADFSPVWSPDGRWIAFARGALVTKPFRDMNEAERDAIRNGREIFVVRPDGSRLRQLTRNDAQDASPFWSNDSRRLYFVCSRSGGDGICSVSLASGEVSFVAPTGNVMRPALSRDGKRIAYAKQVDGKWGIWVYDLALQTERILIGG